MDPIERLCERIAEFPGYNGEQSRRLSDEYVRSYLGEALADVLGDGASLTPELRSRFDELLLRLGFADPQSFVTHRLVEGLGKDDDGGEVAAQDAATVELADRVRSADAQTAANYLEEIARRLDVRQAAMRAAAASTKAP